MWLSPLVTATIRDVVYAAIAQQCKKLGCTVIAVGGIADHVHLLTDFSSNLTVSDLIGKAKGSSSHFVNHEVQPNQFFKWQSSYGAFTVSKNDIDRLAYYVRNQDIHHRQKSIVSGWEL